MSAERFVKTRRMILTRAVLAPFAILMLVCGSLIYHFAVYSRDQVRHELAAVVESRLEGIDSFLEERIGDLEFAAASADLEYLSDPGNLARLLSRLQEGSKAFADLGVFDASGSHLAYIGPYDLAGKEYGQAEWFKAAAKEGVFVSDVFAGYRDVPHFVIAVRGRGTSGPYYLRATIDTMFFNDLVDSVRIGSTGEAYLVNGEGVFQTRRRSGGDIMEEAPHFDAYQLADRHVAIFSLGEGVLERYLYGAGRLERTDWIMVVRQKASDAYAPLARAVAVAFLIMLAGGAVVPVMAYILASNLAQQLTSAEQEKKAMRTQLIVAGKLAEVGEMSAGIAHEINNPLQVMCSELALMNELMKEAETEGKVSPSPELDGVKEGFDQLAVQIERCKKITTGLLGFARSNEPVMEVVRLDDFLPSVVEMIEERARIEDVRLVLAIEPGLPPVNGDENQLQQVFLNLLNNALNAAEGVRDAEIRVTAGLAADTVEVSVADNGRGIEPADMEKIFLPFFTTKPPGKGTGLGLSTALGIVQGMGGDIAAASEVEAGAVFTVRLPAARLNDRAETGQMEDQRNERDEVVVG